MKDLRDAACDYAYRGWSVLPLRPRGKQPLGAAVPNGKNDASNDLATVFRWWTRISPEPNIGINCEASALVVLDVDPRNGGDDTLWELERALGELPATPWAQTGGGGSHILFTHPGVMLRGSLGPGLDVKDNGYIVAPPSTHPSGRLYSWEEHPEEVQLAALPSAWLAKATRPAAAGPSREPVASDDKLRGVTARKYLWELCGRAADHDGWATCPFHANGMERTPSFKAEGTLWSCFGACEPLPGRNVLGGNVYTLAGLLWGYPMPLAGADFAEVRERLLGLL